MKDASLGFFLTFQGIFIISSVILYEIVSWINPTLWHFLVSDNGELSRDEKQD